MQMKRIAIALIIMLAAAACGDLSGTNTAPTDGTSTTATTDDATSPPPSTPASGQYDGTEPEEGQVDPTVTAATGLSSDDENEGDVTDSTIPPTRQDRPATTKKPERVPSADASAPVVGEVPDEMMADIMSHAAANAGATASEFTVVRAEFVVWSDGSLGCPEPGMYYTQATIEGYWVVLDHAGVRYDYRVTVDGHYRLCESPRLGPPSTVPNA